MELNLYSDQENCQTVQSLPPILSFSSMLNEHPENEQVHFWQPMSQIEFQPNSGYQPNWNHFQVYSSYEDQMIELVPVIDNRAVQQISSSKRSKEKRTASINSGIEIKEDIWIFFPLWPNFIIFSVQYSPEPHSKRSSRNKTIQNQDSQICSELHQVFDGHFGEWR